MLHAFCRYVDLNDPARVAALFTEDCEVDYGPGTGPAMHGSATLAKVFVSGLRTFESTSHHLSNIQVTFDGPDVADGVSYVYAWHRFPGDRPDGHVWAQYHDRLVRTAEGWRIARRELRVAGNEGFDLNWYPVGRNP